MVGNKRIYLYKSNSQLPRPKGHGLRLRKKSCHNRLVDIDLQDPSSRFMVEAARQQIIASNAFQLRHCCLFRSEVCVVSLHSLKQFARWVSYGSRKQHGEMDL